MTVAFESSSDGGWGTIRVGNRQVSGRRLVYVLGIVWWLGAMLVQTGSSGWRAVWAAISFVLGSMIVTAATRTMGLRRVAFFFLLGGFMATMGWVLMVAVSRLGSETFVSVFFVPFLEEALKLVPALVILWRWRGRGILSLGALDVMLMAAASGAGAGLLEEAFIRERFAWPDVAYLPAVATESLGRLIAGHAMWSALAGLTLGVALLLRSRGRWAYLLAPSGFVLAVVDHAITNQYANVSDPGLAWRALNGIFLNGYLTSVLLGVGLVMVIALELWIVYVKLPRLPEFRVPWEDIRQQDGGLLEKWRRTARFLFDHRRLAFANFHFRSNPRESERRQTAEVALAVGASLLGQRT